MMNVTSDLGKKRPKDEEVSPGSKPDCKSARREEESVSLPPSASSPSPSSEVEDLRQKLSQAEEKYQKADREAREMKERAERAENQLLDSKHLVADWDGLEKELEKRLVYVTPQLEDARRNAAIAEASRDQVLRDNDALTIHIARFKSRDEAAIRMNTNLEAKNTALEKDLETARIAAEAASQREFNLTEEVSVLKQKLEALKTSEDFATRMKDHLSLANAELTKQLEVAAARVPESPNIRHLSLANAELTKQLEVAAARVPESPNIREAVSGKIASLEKELNEMKQKLEITTGRNEVLTRMNDANKDDVAKSRRKLDEDRKRDRSKIRELERKLAHCEGQLLLNTKGDDFNIFQLCLPNPGKTIPLEDAQKKLRSKFEELEKRNDYSSIWANLSLDCEACSVNVQKSGILDHFLSSKHALKARSHGPAVSLAAVRHWERVLDNRRRRTSDARPVVADKRRRRSSESQAKPDSKPN